MAEIQKIKSICAKYGIRPSKSYGQNFVIDAKAIRMMIEHANLEANDCVVEVGPGLGALTVELVKRVKRVVAVEVDTRLASALEEIVYGEAGPPDARRPGLEILHGDILGISNSKFQIPNAAPYKVVANLPYSITSAVLRKFTEEEPRPSLIVVMVQKEVAERVCAKPGEMSVLSVAVQYYGRPEIADDVPRSAFWPEPGVDSAILRIETFGDRVSGRPETRSPDIDPKRLFQIVRIGFSSRRKQLQNNLTAGLRISREQAYAALRKARLAGNVRPQELAVEHWIALTVAL